MRKNRPQVLGLVKRANQRSLDSNGRILIGHVRCLDGMPAHDYDAIIVGAGPVGGHLGRVLSEHGLHVLMLEEHREIGKPFQCAGLD